MGATKKEGKVAEAYYLPETRRLMVILNCDNVDQWAKDQIKVPILNYVEVETAGALANYDEYLKAILEAAKAAEQKWYWVCINSLPKVKFVNREGAN